MQKNCLIQGDSMQALAGLPAETVHLILSDIPYGIGAEAWDVLHPNTNKAYLGASPAQKKAGAVFQRRGKPLNGWSEADRQIGVCYQEWCGQWAKEWLRLLKPGGSVFVFAGRRMAHRCMCAMEDAGFVVKDMLAWVKKQAPHRAQRLSMVYGKRGDNESAQAWEGWRVGNLKPIFEPVLWFFKPYQQGGTLADNVLKHGVGAYHQVGYEGWFERAENRIACDFERHEKRYHPTQKPLRLMQGLIALSTQPGQLVLDPFAGSGTTLVAAKSLGREYLGFELNPDYAEVAQARLKES